MSFAVDGLATGLDTSGIINQLMQIERQPAVAMQKRIDANKSAESAWRQVRTNMNKVESAASKLRSIGGGFMPTKATSSDPSVTATTRSSAAEGSVNFTVKQVATTASQISSAGLARDAQVNSGAAQISFTNSKGEVKTLDVPANTTLEGLRDLINSKREDLGVAAGLVNTGDGTSRLQISATKSGSQANFSMNLSQLDGLSSIPFTQAAQGQDAVVTLAGTTVDIHSQTNTFDQAIDGVSFSISKDAVGKDVTIDIKRDDAELISRVKGLMDAVNETLSHLDKETSYGIDHKGGKGEVTGQVGKLAGNSTARGLRDQLLRTFSDAVGGNALGSMGAIGVEVTREGKLEFKEDKFKDALANRPESVEQLIRGDGGATDTTSVTARLRAFAKDATDASKGTISKSLESISQTNKTWNDQIEEMNTRLDRKRASLQKQFAAMEKAMGEMQKQQQWLMGQLGTLKR